MYRPGRPGGSARSMKTYVAAVGVYVCGSTLQCPVHRHRSTSQSRGSGVYRKLLLRVVVRTPIFVSLFLPVPVSCRPCFPRFLLHCCVCIVPLSCVNRRDAHETHKTTKPKNKQTGIDGVVSGRLAKSCRGGGLAEGMMYAPAMIGVDIVVVAGTVSHSPLLRRPVQG